MLSCFSVIGLRDDFILKVMIFKHHIMLYQVAFAAQQALLKALVPTKTNYFIHSRAICRTVNEIV